MVSIFADILHLSMHIVDQYGIYYKIHQHINVYKKNVVYTYKEIVFCLNKEGNSAICCNMDKTQGLYAKWNQPVTQRHRLSDFTHIR